MALDFAVNVVLFESASTFALQDEEARELADRLYGADRVLAAAAPAQRPDMARELSSATLSIRWEARTKRPLAAINLAGLQSQMIAHQPRLALTGLQLHLPAMPIGHRIGGTMVLADGSVITFAAEAHETWPLKAGHLLRLVLPSLALILLAWALTLISFRSLRRLVHASRRVGTPHARPLEETGPAEMRHLIRAFNVMQRRINDLLDTNTQTMLAIGHDMRTPLARLQLRLDGMDIDPRERDALYADIDEMRDLFTSLQTFVHADAEDTPPERVDIAAMAQTLVDAAQDRGARAEYAGPAHLVVQTRSVALRRALANLVDNALHYGGNVRVTLDATPTPTVIIEDDGPGIPEESLAKVRLPFVRLDAARGRMHGGAGMGLGLAIVDRSLRTVGGCLELANRPEGGLRATIRLPG